MSILNKKLGETKFILNLLVFAVMILVGSFLYITPSNEISFVAHEMAELHFSTILSSIPLWTFTIISIICWKMFRCIKIIY